MRFCYGLGMVWGIIIILIRYIRASCRDPDVVHRNLVSTNSNFQFAGLEAAWNLIGAACHA